jgi:RNA polymerase sigma-70 factor (ECF subfamily)
VIARVLEGDIQQFEHLVTRYQSTLYRHALSMVMDRAVAADMVQDAFVRTYTNLRECRDHARYRAWLFQTLRNRCLDYLKEAARRNVRLDDAGPIVDESENPCEIVERERLRTSIERALMQLSAAQREVFVLHYVDGMPYETMAELLDVSVSAVKMRALRAREALVAALRGSDVTGRASASSGYQRG